MDVTVLVVDDDPAILGFVEMALADEGCEVLTATNGQRALEALENNKPDVILLDLTMPIMNGYEFHEELKSRRNGPSHVPVVIMTAGQRASEACEELGAAGFLSKPFDLYDLVKVVHKCGNHGH
ncbi:MAG: response regulator [Chloroflexi bacterium]|nr:response regulator [Chloroflexota bacterium]